MSNDQVLFTVGQIVGLLSKMSDQELRDAAETTGLRHVYRRQLRELLKFRRELWLDPPKPKEAL